MKRNFARTSLFTLLLLPFAAVAAETKVPDPISFQSVSQLLLGLLLVVSLIFALAWAVRRANFVPGQGSGMRVVASLALSARERAVLVQCGDKQLLLGVAPGSVQLLAQFDEAVIEPSTVPKGEFANRLAQILQQTKGS